MFIRQFPLMDQAGGDGGAGGAGGAGAGQGGATPWHSTFDADTKGWVENKGWHSLSADKALPEIISSYRNTEKYIGVPADQIIRLPKDGDDAARSAVYDRLGRPKDAKDYQLKLPEGVKPEGVESLKPIFHKHGLNSQQASGLLADLLAQEKVEETAQAAQYSAKVDAEAAALSKEWGVAEEKNVVVAKGAAKELGVSAEAIDALEKTIGHAATMKFFYNIGVKFGEDKFVGGDGGKFGNVKSPSAALSEMQTLRNDAAFVDKLTKGDAEATAKWNRLNEQAYSR